MVSGLAFHWLRDAVMRGHEDHLGRHESHAASALGTVAIGKNRLSLPSGNVVAMVSFDLATATAKSRKRGLAWPQRCLRTSSLATAGGVAPQA